MKKLCPKCKKENLNQYVCEYCKTPMNYEHMSNWKETTIIDNRYSNESFNFEINKNFIITISILIIALSIALVAYSKYKEQQQIENMMNGYTNLISSSIKIANESEKSIKKNFSNINKDFQKYNNNLVQNNENRILKSKVNQLEHKIKNYQIDKYYTNKAEMKKRNDALQKMKDDIKAK